MGSNGGRRGKQYLQLCADVRKLRLDCALCGLPIDYNAAPRSRWSFSLEHPHSLVHGGALLDRNNATAAHYGCNSRRGGATRRNRPERRPSPVMRNSQHW